jgi:hypothetical protein
LVKKKRKFDRGGNRRGKDPVDDVNVLLEKENLRDWNDEKETIKRYLALLNEKKRALNKEIKGLETKIKSTTSGSADQTELDGKIAILSQQRSDLETSIEEMNIEKGTHTATPPLTPDLFSFMSKRGINNVVDANFLTTIGRQFGLVENKGRGHCGYYALRDMFLEMKRPGIHKDTSVNDLRKMVWDLFMENPQETHDLIYKMMNVPMDYSNEMFEDMVDCIWNDETNWKKAVKAQYHMDFQFDIPVICSKLGLNIMVYDVNVNQTFCYSPTESQNTSRLEQDFIIGEVESVHRMVRYNDHYRYIEKLEDAS